MQPTYNVPGMLRDSNMRRYSVTLEQPATLPYFPIRQESPPYRNYSLFSPYRQSQLPDFSQSCAELQYDVCSGPMSPPSRTSADTPAARDRILSCSEGRRKKGNLVDFAVKYKTEVIAPVFEW